MERGLGAAGSGNSHTIYFWGLAGRAFCDIPAENGL